MVNNLRAVNQEIAEFDTPDGERDSTELVQARVRPLEAREKDSKKSKRKRKKIEKRLRRERKKIKRGKEREDAAYELYVIQEVLMFLDAKAAAGQGRLQDRYEFYSIASEKIAKEIYQLGDSRKDLKEVKARMAALRRSLDCLRVWLQWIEMNPMTRECLSIGGGEFGCLVVSFYDISMLIRRREGDPNWHKPKGSEEVEFKQRESEETWRSSVACDE